MRTDEPTTVVVKAADLKPRQRVWLGSDGWQKIQRVQECGPLHVHVRTAANVYVFTLNQSIIVGD